MIYNGSKYNTKWNAKKLTDLGSFSRGVSKHRPRNDEKLFADGKYPLVQTGEIKEANLYLNHHTQEYGEFGLQQSKLWGSGTLCITIAANIAETAILAYPMCFPDSVVGFIADQKESSELYMYYIFEYIRQTIQNAASGSIQDNINIEYLTSLEFRIPTKEDQEKIVALLGTIDKAIINNNEINDNLQQLIQTIYDYWFKTAGSVISEILLFLFLSVIGFSVWHRPCHRIQPVPCAAVHRMELFLFLFALLRERYVFVHDINLLYKLESVSLSDGKKVSDRGSCICCHIGILFFSRD